MSVWFGRATIVAALVIAALLVALVVAFLGSIGSAGIDDAAKLPATIGICGRDWTKDAAQRRFSLAEIRAGMEVEPVVVDPGLFAPCPPGPCTRVAQDGPCHTVIYVRVGQDAFIDYSLQGGP